jgi:hypothetical protein
MLLRAADLSPAQSDRHRRMMEAAYVGAHVTGQLRTAVQLLDVAQQDGPAGSLRAPTDMPCLAGCSGITRHCSPPAAAT